MKTLTIGDLSRNEHLDRPTMSAVRGGWRVNASVHSFGKPGQQQDTAKGAALAGGAPVDGDLTQPGGKGIIRP